MIGEWGIGGQPNKKKPAESSGTFGEIQEKDFESDWQEAKSREWVVMSLLEIL